ncbi:MAG: 3-deoxy-manno-octulosonate cytidylyltransferase [Pseudomonadota bacterium]
MSFRVVIPARYASTRLPGKPLLLIAGRPMVEHVWRRAQAAGALEVFIATDDERIATVARAFGAAVVLTSPAHPSGTDRLAEVAHQRGWSDETVVVNVQGDEPLLPSANVTQVAQLLEDDPGAAMATLMTPVRSEHDFRDPNVVKVVTNQSGRALYFSRAPIPWPRDGQFPEGLGLAWRHIGLYAYRVGALRRLAGWAPTPLEHCERLEQLRALENGLAIAIAPATETPGPGVDTAEDLQRVAALLAV